MYCARMNTRLTLDKAGRVVIPKPLRDELHLEPGAVLELEFAGEEITLRPVRGTAAFDQREWECGCSEPVSRSPPRRPTTCSARSARNATQRTWVSSK